jgi:hypothetical protein
LAGNLMIIFQMPCSFVLLHLPPVIWSTYLDLGTREHGSSEILIENLNQSSCNHRNPSTLIKSETI